MESKEESIKESKEEDKEETYIIKHFTDIKIKTATKVINTHKLILLSSEYLHQILVSCDETKDINVIEELDTPYESVLNLLDIMYPHVLFHIYETKIVELPASQYVDYIKLCFKWITPGNDELFCRSLDNLHDIIQTKLKQMKKENNLKAYKEYAVYLAKVHDFLKDPMYMKTYSGYLTKCIDECIIKKPDVIPDRFHVTYPI